MKLITWNINSIRARLDNLAELVKKHNPDIICLQETKCMDEQFPYNFVKDLGYNVAVRGQKAFYGVAIMSKFPIEVIYSDLPGDKVKQARYLEVITNGLHVIGIYAPNGNPIHDPIKFPYKVEWTRLLANHVEKLFNSNKFFIVAGDYNIAPKDEDCYDPAAFANNSITQPAIRFQWERMKALGMKDLLRDSHPEPIFTYWDYQYRSWAKNNGLRIDHILIPNQFSHLIRSIHVDRETRGSIKPSDHAPVVCRLV